MNKKDQSYKNSVLDSNRKLKDSNKNRWESELIEMKSRNQTACYLELFDAIFSKKFNTRNLYELDFITSKSPDSFILGTD